LVEFASEVDGQGAGVPKRGEAWFEVAKVDGDDAAVEVGVEVGIHASLAGRRAQR